MTTRRMNIPSLRERFEMKTIPEPNSGCVIWLGTLNRYGYGLFQGCDTNSTLAHRTAYELEFGSIPGGLGLDHLCRVRCCVNPHHLEPVTDQENIRRAAAFRVPGATRFRMRATHCDKGHLLSEDNLYLSKRGRQCRTCVLANAKARHTAKKQGRVL